MHQDFERYAKERSMEGMVGGTYRHFFKKRIAGEIKTQSKILDFGCGDGKYLDFFRDYFNEEDIFGIEISQIRIERCKANGWKNAILLSRLDNLPFYNESLDFINLDQVIEHIPSDEISFYLREFIRVLKPFGKLIIVTPNYPMKRVYDIMNSLMLGSYKRIFDDPTHVTHYNFPKLEELLEKYFSNVTLEPTGGLFYRFSNRNIHSHKIIGLCEK